VSQTAAAPRGGPGRSFARGPRSFSGSLAGRMMLASAVLALLVASAFAVILLAVATLREATTREARAKDVTAATLSLEKLVVDLETGLRGLVLTGQDRFLQPWTQAREKLPSQLAAFQRLAEPDPVQRQRARRIQNLINEYILDYAVPVIDIAHENRAAVRTPAVAGEGKRRTDEIRALFASFLEAENARAAASSTSADSRSDRAIALGIAGLVACASLVVLFGVLLARSIARPVRDVAVGATRLAGGDLSLRLEEGGPGEVGELTRAFNAMAEALEGGRTELEEQNARLRQSEELKSELVSIVSHEVRTPLASVLGFTSLLLHRDVDPETRRDYLEIIDAQGRRLAALLDDFLNVQRIEEGRLELAEERVDMAALLREQTQLFRAESPRHTLALRVVPEPLLVRGDANRLSQVIGNLLSNAIKYSPEGGVVEVVGEDEDGVVFVSVRDEGVGIPEDQQERIFTKFFRGDAAASGIAGSGLGLAFARAVVEAHGGRMSFKSDPGGGSTFWVELPRAEPVRVRKAD
jgi:signal transduction histidine kinase